MERGHRIAGFERKISRARNHNVIRNRDGFVVSEYIPDLPPAPLAELRAEFNRRQAEGENIRLEFLGHKDPYPKEVNGKVRTVRHGVDDGVTHKTTGGSEV